MKIDRILFWDIIFILIFGLLMVLSSLGGFIMFSNNFLMGSEKFIKQLVVAFMGFLAMLGLSKVDYRVIRSWVRPIFIIAVLLLGAVLVIGGGLGGVKRWLSLGPINFQPSELAKYALVLFLASAYEKKRDEIDNIAVRIKYFYTPIAIVIGLIVVEPNFGTAFVISLISLTMLFVMGFDVKELGALVLLALTVLTVEIIATPYARMRVAGFLNLKGAKASGTQSMYSIFAIGSGRLFGLGLGGGMTKLFFLPRAYTDFIFSVIGEELGFIGAFLMIVAYIVLIVRGMKIAKMSKDTFAFLASYGITITVAYYVIFNILIALKLFPVTGLPLPFVSVGGSSLMITLSAMGVLLSISKSGEDIRSENDFYSFRRNGRTYFPGTTAG
ncbi:MAG: FtsW/RodA/SpoVE family cell cycle protein [Proteobacteria bacterium]|nr:FtsW/RodA/SpoVE family cell cycle protein [Pseudomonadota bacterium]